MDLAPALPDDSDYALVGPTDNRVHELHTERFPFSTVCHLGRNFGDGRLRGCSGCLIDPLRLVTAAHCLYSPALGRSPLRVRVAPGRADRDRFPFGTVDAAAAYVPRRFVSPQGPDDRRESDYGILILKRPFPGIGRFLPVRALPDLAWARLGPRTRLTVAGYPGDRPIGTLWRHSESLRRLTPRRLFYTVDTCPGHSGSPIWAELPDGPTLVGVHTSGILDEQGRSYGCAPGTTLAPPGTLNSGVRLTPWVLANLLDPERRVGGQRPMVRVL
jgi:V8-like Glu-specific endopeptidase